MKYRNRISRKQFVGKMTVKAKGIINSTTKKLEELVQLGRSLDDRLYEDIRSGLDFGYTPKYYVFKESSIYNPSIENEYIQYFKFEADNETYEQAFYDIVKILEIRFEKYTDIEVKLGEDEDGKYFEVGFKE